MDKFLYPIVVAVSVVTTFTTPYMIKLAKPFAEKIEPIIPSRIKELLDNYAASKTEIQESKAWWKVVAANYIGNILIYGILCIAIMIAAHLWLFPLMADLIPGHIGTLIGTIITLTTMAPFLWAMSMRKINTQIIRTLRIEKGVNQVPLVLLFVLRYLTAIALVIGFLLTVYSYIGMFIGLAIFAISMLLFSKTIQKQFGKLEENFYNNLNQRELSRKGHGLIHNLQIATMKLQETSPLAGVKLMESDIRNKYGVNIVSISRGARRINIPGGDVRLFPGDTIGVIGTAEQIHDFLPIAESGEIKNAVTSSQEVKYAYVSISEQSAWRGQTIRNLHLCEYYGTRLHMCHVSTKEAVEAIGAAKWKGVPVTCEVTPHHLWFADTDYRVNPPIRKAEDVEALIEAIRLGVVDAIATDHAPHTDEEKAAGAAGMVGLETAFGVCYTKLCKENGLPLARLAELMSTAPAEILGLAGHGRVLPGYAADLALVELDTPYTVDKNALHSKSHNCPSHGAQLYGRVDLTLKGGKVTWKR